MSKKGKAGTRPGREKTDPQRGPGPAVETQVEALPTPEEVEAMLTPEEVQVYRELAECRWPPPQAFHMHLVGATVLRNSGEPALASRAETCAISASLLELSRPAEDGRGLLAKEDLTAELAKALPDRRGHALVMAAAAVGRDRRMLAPGAIEPAASPARPEQRRERALGAAEMAAALSDMRKRYANLSNHSAATPITQATLTRFERAAYLLEAFEAARCEELASGARTFLIFELLNAMVQPARSPQERRQKLEMTSAFAEAMQEREPIPLAMAWAALAQDCLFDLPGDKPFQGLWSRTPQPGAEPESRVN